MSEELKELQQKHDDLQREHQQLKQQFKELSFSHSALDGALAEEIQAKIRAKTTIASQGFVIQELQSEVQKTRKETNDMLGKYNDILSANKKLLAENEELTKLLSSPPQSNEEEAA
jgi:regulator of replication initiation timing